MIAVDTNILVHAHRADSPFHDRARLTLESLAAGLGMGHSLAVCA